MYQLLMARHEDRLVKVRPGTLYHAVGRLESDGLLEATGTDRDGRRPERTTYRITESGRTALSQRLAGMLSDAVNEYPVFPHAIAEAHNLPSGVVLELLDTRLGALEEQLALLERGREGVIAKGVERKYWVDVEYQQAMLRTEIDWIRGFQAELRSGELPWHVHAKDNYATSTD
jgi:DNA-binding PadR family transcriptional regulator